MHKLKNLYIITSSTNTPTKAKRIMTTVHINQHNMFWQNDQKHNVVRFERTEIDTETLVEGAS